MLERGAEDAVVRGVELHLVDTVAVPVVRREHRRVHVRELRVVLEARLAHERADRAEALPAHPAPYRSTASASAGCDPYSSTSCRGGAWFVTAWVVLTAAR